MICLALGYGSKGSEVKKLQKTLNSQGAGLKVDGVWGPKTQAAFEKYGTKAAAKTTAAKASGATPRVEYMQYKPITEAKKRAAAKAQTDPAYDAELKELEEGYESARQDNENEALKRGMSRSSYVLDVRSALGAHNAEDKSALEGERAAKLQALIAELTQKDEEKAEDAWKYNNEIAMQLEQMRVKQAEAQRKYELELKKLAAQAAKSTSKSTSSKSSGGTKKGSTSASASKTSSVNYYDYYSKNYLQKYGNNPTVARVLYYADRINLQKKLGSAAVKKLDAIADRLKSNSVTASTMR